MSSWSGNSCSSLYGSESLTLTVLGGRNPESCLLPSVYISYRLRTIMKETATISPKERVFSERISSCEADMILHLKTKEQGSRGNAIGRSAGILNRSLNRNTYSLQI